MTHGRARLRREFRGYEEMPGEAAQRVITETHAGTGGDGGGALTTATASTEYH